MKASLEQKIRLFKKIIVIREKQILCDRDMLKRCKAADVPHFLRNLKPVLKVEKYSS
jgi:hypothetical protein